MLQAEKKRFRSKRYLKYATIEFMQYSYFLSMLELVQLHYMSIMIGEGRNNFIMEWNENREEESV